MVQLRISLSSAFPLLVGLLSLQVLSLPLTALGQVDGERQTLSPSHRGMTMTAPRVAPQAPTQSEEGPQRRLALVVGNAAYRSIRSLKNSGNDASDMCAALARLNFEVTCLHDIATAADFRRAVRQFSAQLNPQSAALFYYAGHGVQIDGRNYLLPTAIAPSSAAELEAESLGLSDIFAQLRQGRAAVNIVVLDACRDDPFSGTRGVRLSRGLAREDPPPDAVLVYSTAPGSAAADGKSRNGLFTSHLLAEIEKPGPQIGELFRGVARRVEQEARSGYGLEQVPYRSFSFSGVFCFVSCDDTRIAAQMESLKLQRAAALQRIRELESLNSTVNREGSRSGDRLLQDDSDRLAEIQALHQQLTELISKTAQLETFRQRIAALEKEAREKDQQLADGAKKEEARRSRPTVVPTF